MSRTLKNKELNNMRLASTYGGWMYCSGCDTNIGYLCYVTYDKFKFEFECNCGNKGSGLLEFEDTSKTPKSDKELITIKNRSCCPNDEAPLYTIMDKKVKNYQIEVTCNNCNQTFKTSKK